VGLPLPAAPVLVDPAVPELLPEPAEPDPAAPLPADPDPVVLPVPDPAPDPPDPDGSSLMEPLHPARNAPAEMTAHAQTVWTLMWLPWSVVDLTTRPAPGEGMNPTVWIPAPPTPDHTPETESEHLHKMRSFQRGARPDWM
jgi:hypothetical protein